MFKKISTRFLVLRSKHDVGRSRVSLEFFSLSMLFRTLSVRNVGELGKNTLVFSSGFSVLPRGRYSRLEAETNRELYNPKKKNRKSSCSGLCQHRACISGVTS